MKSAQIREQFLHFFESRGHTRVESSPLVPAGDSTLLFTNSGMVQFKDVFLGFDRRPYATAATAQRCLRAGGKHNDLENVGYTSRHHTFFEMLGNFSFGEYFKEKAVPLAWEFLTAAPEQGGLGLKKEHLWVTVFGGGRIFGEDTPPVPADEAAFTWWKKTLEEAGFSEAESERRIIRIPTTDNFWMMGDAGPCGPCSEIFYDCDAGATHFRGEDAAHADTCVEVWNLVFMEYNRDDNGALHNLPAPCVDTGMGLERISAVMQGVGGNYQIDMFAALLAAVNRQIVHAGGADCEGNYTPSHRVVADHIRAAAFLIADGVTPDNEGRGYVLRKIIRRGLIHGNRAAQQKEFGREPWFCHLSEQLPGIMESAGDILHRRREHIKNVLAEEERGFYRSFVQGRARLEEKINAAKNRRSGGEKIIFPGAAAFELYDTFGFPLEATIDIINADDAFGGTDRDAFAACMTAQRTRSRAAAKFNAAPTTAAYDGPATDFVGYCQQQAAADILALFVNGDRVPEARAGDRVLVVLNQTPFYAEAGGQIGDSGTLCGGGVTAAVDDTQKIRGDAWAHAATVSGGVLAVGARVQCQIDRSRRAAIMRAHSATHLMHAALRQVLGSHVGQKGSLVAADYLRFDFSHNAAMNDEQLRTVEQIVNAQIRANAATTTEILPFAEATARGATALFGEKYGETVRVVAIDADFSMELCGGTHVARAGDIGFFQCLGEGAIAAGVRRIEAATAGPALQRVQDTAAQLRKIAALLKSPPEQTVEKTAQLRETLKSAQKQIAALRAAQTATQADAMAAQTETINGRQILICQIADGDGKLLRETISQLRGKLPQAAILLVAASGGKAALAASGGGGISAREWLTAAAAVLGAKGGGKDSYAQAGGGDASQINAALKAARAYLDTTPK